MKTKLKSILAVALCAVGLAAFAAEPDAVQLWEGGPYFATCNVGANAPQDSGINTNFNDAAQVVTDVMGAGWRAPTAEEFTNLLNNCDHSWSNNYDNTGIEGLMFTSKSDSSKSIFLPAVSAGAGRYWTSSEKDSVYAWYLYFDEGEISIGANPRVAGAINVRAVRDTPPNPEISAVSAEGFLDLTVGDRVAEAEEPIVADPKWGNGKKAFVKIDGEDPAREYPELSIDKWFTSALTPGRYEMTFTSGETNETAAFWKTGDDWVVLDLPPYSTAGIEFQSDKTYLALGQYEFAGTAPLTVLDGAKFEYGPGAGFKGGKLEMPRRYRKEVVEGDLYRIVEAIKGCEDNPWVIGDDGEDPPKNLVEAYTNGNELVIVGTGTITDLSEIPAGVKGGITEIAINAGVTGAADGAFTGFNDIALTLPDGWQGELPDAGRKWYDATNVELTRMPMAVKNVKVQQRYPWNGLVDVTCDLTGEGSVKVTLSVTADGKLLADPTVTGETTFDLEDGKELKDCRITWDAKADFGDEKLHEKIKVKLTITPAEPD